MVGNAGKAKAAPDAPHRHQVARAPHPSNRFGYVITSSVILLIAFFVRLHTFAPLEVGLDGALSMDLAASPVREILAFNALDVHPPLFYLLLKGWYIWAGEGYITAKVLVSALSVVATAALIGLGAHLGSRGVGLLAALLFVFAPTNVLLGPAVRDYTPGIAASLVAILVAVVCVRTAEDHEPVKPASTSAAAGTAGDKPPRYKDSQTSPLPRGDKPPRYKAEAISPLPIEDHAQRNQDTEASPLSAADCPPRDQDAETSPLPTAEHRAHHNDGEVLAHLDVPLFPTTSAGAFSAYLALAVATAAAMVTWYFHLVVLALCGLLALGARGRARVPTIVALTTGCALAAPWYAFALPPLVQKVHAGTTAYGGAPTVPTAASLLGPVSHGLGGAIPYGWPDTWTLIPWLGALMLGAMAWSLPRADCVTTRRWLPFAGLLLGALFVGALATRWNVPDDLARYVIILVPFAALVQAGGAIYRQGAARWLSLAVIVLLITTNLTSFARLISGAPIDWAHDEALRDLREHLLPGDAVIFNDRARRLRFNLAPHPAAPAYVVHSAGQRYLQAHLADDARAVLDKALPGARRLWYVSAGDPVGSPPVVKEMLASRWTLLDRRTPGGTEVTLWLTQTPDRPSPGSPTFGTLARLDRGACTGTASPGEALVIELAWHVIAPLPESYTVLVHVEDTDGRTVAQHDGTPVAGLRPTPTWRPDEVVIDRHGVLLPADLPPGRYRIFVGLYRGDTRLTLPDGSNQWLLGTTTITPT